VLLSLLLITNQTEDAKKILAKRLANSTAANLGSVIAQTQRHLARIPDRARAASLLKELLEPYRNSVEAQLAIAKSALDAGKASDAMKESRDVVSKNPQSELAVLSLIQLREDKNEALKVLADFLQKNPKSRDIRLTYARLLLELGKVAEAKKEFKTLLQQVPQEQTSLYAMGLLAAQSGEFTEAENYLAAYIKTLNGNRDPERDSSQALMVLAQIAEDKNDLPTAVKWLEQVDSSAQNNFLTAVIKRALIKAKAGQLAEARQLLAQTSTENDEDKIKLLIGEAQLLRDTGKLNESLQFIEEALQRFTDNTDLLYEYAMVAEKNSQLDLMEQSLRKIITLTPNSPHPYNALGYMLADRNVRLKEAHELISKAVALAPDDAYILDSMGWVEFRMGQLDKAEEILRRAYGIKPDSEIAAHLGEVLWTKGRNDEAKKLWRAAASKDPKNETLKKTLQRLRIKL
jgi:tetratricopeptide (TPR) repeat protein